MEMPITRPSKVSYADEINFAELLEKLQKNRHNGFIRVSLGPNEGYILFKDGKQVASSYNRYSKSEAIKEIQLAIEESNTVIEVFDLRSSHVDYLIDVNKPFLLEPDYDVYKIIAELKKPEIPDKSEEPEESKTESLTPKEPVVKPADIPKAPSKPTAEKPEPTPEKEPLTEPEVEKPPTSEVGVKSASSEAEPTPEKRPLTEPEVEKPPTSEVGVKPIAAEAEPVAETPEESQKEVKITAPTEKAADTKTEAAVPSKENLSPEVKSGEAPGTEAEISESVESEKEIIDRTQLMKKYGIKDVNEEDVEDLLESYKGGYINDDDVEKIELTLMNRIKKSIFGIPKIKGAEVMVFLDNTKDLSGTVNIITDYESKGFFSRLMGESREVENLRRQIINIIEIELKRSFRKFPEIIDRFDINVEIG